MISALIHGIVSGLLVFVLIGFSLLGILGGRSIAFPIIGAVKANEGVVWAYQLSIEFFA
ncbi:DUF4870 domain-containing protein [Hymenobacter sp. RP-2-7]|uniref:DUF4870 domain-containing protein n=1 Tax=Hymenobacter polaris TaxID=2682546 RepID=A0A7Y0FNW0_9BACT|nr:DUF4870 domain-containing protein [Hymenobacter polaris]NML66930.1 DUF4870 domain-containing protein [Hymenobacter polaris]